MAAKISTYWNLSIGCLMAALRRFSSQSYYWHMPINASICQQFEGRRVKMAGLPSIELQAELNARTAHRSMISLGRADLHLVWSVFIAIIAGTAIYNLQLQVITPDLFLPLACKHVATFGCHFGFGSTRN
jgi:hypothetical protein